MLACLYPLYAEDFDPQQDVDVFTAAQPALTALEGDVLMIDEADKATGSNGAAGRVSQQLRSWLEAELPPDGL